MDLNQVPIIILNKKGFVLAGGSQSVVLAAVGGNSVITILKFGGWFFSRSPSLLAEAIHSLADTVNQFLILIGIRQSLKAVGLSPTGQGMARYTWGLVSAMGIFFVGFGVTAYHGMHALLHPHAGEVQWSWVGFSVLVVSFIIEFYVLVMAYVEVKKQKGNKSFVQHFLESDDPTSTAILLEDGIAVLGVIVALFGNIFGYLTQSHALDAVASLIVALLLGVMAVLLALVNGKLLIGVPTDLAKEVEIKKFVEGLKYVKSVEHFQTKVLGASRLRLSLELELIGETFIDQAQLSYDVKDIEKGQDPAKILTKSSARMIRIVGQKINEMELAIQEKFPQITIIDFEVH